ncbi:YceI family protein [Streptomyces sp. WI04-05B]|uniref:YceI family protein n=1 Tax=Streptomyces TaxID=1883 RepID=UPI0029A39106|nr:MULTISPECIES: YceI family protein [unclassified Streptomyces]MDX2546989.1 YceI family protein [Streptomyces sp. WI04-05B]MDX2589373.1 YceI family protein [Streptomyces sp. WI04-05A]MDX3748157.1 YceI family protein [Streptomyces sp. AK08-02]
MEWKIDPAHSSVEFSVRYLVSTIHGRFTGLRGPVRLTDVAEGETPELVSFEADFDVTSVESGAPLRDKHIKGEEILDAATHPEATVRLVSLSKDVASKYLMTVELTLRGITRAVDLVADTAGPLPDAYGVPRVGATATGRLKRGDFGISAFQGFISDDIEFTVNVQAVPASVPDEQLPPAK